MFNFVSPRVLREKGILGMNRRNIHYIGRYNERKNFPLVDNKLKTKEIAQAAGIAVPSMIGVIRNHSEIPRLKKILEGVDGFVVKPAQGSAGKGIIVIVRREGEFFVKANGERLRLRDIQKDISGILSGLYSLGGKYDVAMIETLVEFDPVFDRYSYEGVPDIRVVVYRGFPAMAMLRCSTKESDGKANLHQGAVGVGIDLGTGRPINAVQHGYPIDRHPDTGYDFSELKIPCWKRLMPLAASCYDITNLGYLGVDIVLDKKLGPLILELNARPGLAIQIANRQGELPRFNLIDKQPTNLTLKERVEFSIKNFSIKS